MTSAISAGTDPSAQAAIRAARFEPRPEIITPTLSRLIPPAFPRPAPGACALCRWHPDENCCMTRSPALALSSRHDLRIAGRKRRPQGRTAANISDRRRFAMILPLALARVGKRFGWLLAGMLLIVLAAGWRAEPARAQDGADPYSASVKVDATADNVVDARRLARRDGERRALMKVIERISGAPTVQLPPLDDNAITDMVKSFEVADERMSAVRYLADYTFHFYPQKVQRLLRKSGLAAAPAAAGPAAAAPSAAAGAGAAAGVVVLPVYKDGAKAVLWGDPNPWRDAWSEHAPVPGPVPLIVPLGDAGDLAAIDAQRAQAGQPEALTAITRRNNGGEVIVALAKQRREAGGLAGLDVKLSGYRDGRLIVSSGESIAANPGESEVGLLQRAVAVTAGAIEGLETALSPLPPRVPDQARRGRKKRAALRPSCRSAVLMTGSRSANASPRCRRSGRSISCP